MSKNIVIDSTYDEVNIAILNEHNGVTDNEKPIVCDEAKAYFQAGNTLYRKEFGMISEYEVTTVSKYSCVIVANVVGFYTEGYSEKNDRCQIKFVCRFIHAVF